MPKKNNGYSFAKQQARRDKRRQEAEARQAAYDKLTIAEKVTLAIQRGGSQKELAKLEKAKTPKAAKASDNASGVEVKAIEPAEKPNRRERRKAKAKS